MSSKKENYNDIIVSRVTVSLFMFSFLAVLTWLYILPFKKVYLQINDYHEIIEYIAMAVTALFAIIATISFFRIKRKKIDYSKRIVTPFMLCLYSFCAFITALIVPLSGNRTVTYIYCIEALLILFISYATYNLINKGFVFYSVVAGSYILAFLFCDYMYSGSVDLREKISLSYSAFLIVFSIIIVLIALIFYLLSKKGVAVKPQYIELFSVIALIGVIVRAFVRDYVSTTVIILEIIAFIFISVIEKKKIRFKK